MVVRLASIIEAARRGRHGRPAAGWAWKPALLFVAISFGTLFAIRTSALDPMRVPSSSMAPTLRAGELLLADRLSIHWRAPARGEVVIYDGAAGNGRPFVGRVVALAGDQVAVHGGALIINSHPVPHTPAAPITILDPLVGERTVLKVAAATRRESLGGHDYTVAFVDHHEPLGAPRSGDSPTDDLPCAPSLTPTPDGAACIVPAGSVFILGDNRDNSNDSRVRGAVPVSAVRARVIGVVLGGLEGRLTNLGRTE